MIIIPSLIQEQPIAVFARRGVVMAFSLVRALQVLLATGLSRQVRKERELLLRLRRRQTLINKPGLVSSIDNDVPPVAISTRHLRGFSGTVIAIDYMILY